MKKFIYILLASVTVFSYAKSVPQMTLYEYVYSDGTDRKQQVKNYILQEYGNLFLVAWMQLDFAVHLEVGKCKNPEALANFYKRKCDETNKELKKTKLGDVFKAMEKNL